MEVIFVFIKFVIMILVAIFRLIGIVLEVLIVWPIKAIFGIRDEKESASAISSVQLSEVDNMNGHEFEKWCAGLLKLNGYHDITVTKGSGDQGADIIAYKDNVKYAFQCKRYSSNIGNTPIQEVMAGMVMYDCKAGAVITNQHFTSGAIELAKKANIDLIDRDRLLRMMENANEVGKNSIPKMKSMRRTKRKNGKEMEDVKSMWPHQESANIDVEYFENLPKVDFVEGMKEYINVYPFDPIRPPQFLENDKIITIISEPFTEEDLADHFAKVIEKHASAVTKVVKKENEFFVEIRTHVYSVLSSFTDLRDGNLPCYTFANWS